MHTSYTVARALKTLTHSIHIPQCNTHFTATSKRHTIGPITEDNSCTPNDA